MQRLQRRYRVNATGALYNSHRVTVRLNSKTVNSNYSMTAAVTGHRRRMVIMDIMSNYRGSIQLYNLLGNLNSGRSPESEAH